MQKNYRKLAIIIVAFLLCFSFVVNVHCVMLVGRYRDVYTAPPMWVNDRGEYVASASITSDEGNESSENPAVSEDVDHSEDKTEFQDSEKSEKSEEAKEQTQNDVEKTGNIVYLTNSGTKFHRDGCSSLSKSKISISYEDALARGFEPCGRCKP